MIAHLLNNRVNIRRPVVSVDARGIETETLVTIATGVRARLSSRIRSSPFADAALAEGEQVVHLAPTIDVRVGDRLEVDDDLYVVRDIRVSRDYLGQPHKLRLTTVRADTS